MISPAIRPNDFVNGTAADAESVDLDFNTIYGKVNDLINALSSASEGESFPDNMMTPEIEGLANGTLTDKLKDIVDQMAALALGGIPDGSLVLSKFATELQRLMSEVKKGMANSLALQGTDALPNMNMLYDLFDNTNIYSSGLIDTTKSRVTVAVVSGATSITLESGTDFEANKEYTIQQSDKKEAFVLTSVTDNVLTVPALTNSFDIGAIVYRSNVFFDQGKMVAAPVRSSLFPVKLATPAALPTGACNKSAYSADGIFFAIATATTPYFAIYKRSGDSFVKLPNPSSMPSSACNSVSFSPDGKYLTVGTSSRIYCYKITGESFALLQSPTSYPAGTISGVAYSPDSVYCAIAHSSSPYVTIYKIDDDAFNKLANPATLPTSACTGVSWSTDGLYLALSCNTTPFMAIYKRSEDTFNKLTNPSILPTGAGKSAAFSKDGMYLAIAHTTTPFVSIYKRSGDLFTKLANPATLPTGNATGVFFSKDGTYLAVSHATTPYVTMYDINLDVFTKLPDPVTAPTGNGNCVAFGFNDLYLTVGHATSPYISTYKVGAQVTSVDARYDITPSAATNEIDAWVYREVETDFSVDAYLSIAASAAAESFAVMTKTTTSINSNLVEDKFIGTVETADSKVSLRLTINRTTSSAKGLNKLLGAVV